MCKKPRLELRSEGFITEDFRTIYNELNRTNIISVTQLSFRCIMCSNSNIDS